VQFSGTQIEFVNLLNEEHQIQHDVSARCTSELVCGGAGDQNKVSQAKQKYTSQSPNAQQ
jgi:hypothetical protein